MSDEQRKDEEHEVEAHRSHLANTEPAEEGQDDDEVEAHRSHLRPSGLGPSGLEPSGL